MPDHERRDIDEMAEYYAARAPIYDESAGYLDADMEELREPKKERYRQLFRGRNVLEIACGTGYWTTIIGEVAASLLAVDVNPSLVSMTEERCRHLPNVSVLVADAYSMAGVPEGFDTALALWWWSHMPRGRIAGFLRALHSKLAPGSPVLFMDHLGKGPHHHPTHLGVDGDNVQHRVLPDGRSFDVVKNFPDEEEFRTHLHGIAEDVEFVVRPDEKEWTVTYRVKATDTA